MNLDQIFSLQQELTIKYPNGKPSDFKMQLLSIDSTPYHQTQLRQAQRDQNRDTEKTVEEMLTDRSEQLASCIVGWSGLSSGGADLPYSPQEAIKLIDKPENAWIREQVEGFVTKRVNYFRESPEAA